MIKSHITDGCGNKTKVTEDGRLVVTNDPLPEVGVENRYQYFQGRLGSTGLDDGTLNMNVDGSVTPQSFYVKSDVNYDLYINQITIVIADAAVSHNNFGGVNELTNGWDLKLTEAGTETYLIEKAKTGGQVMAQSGFGRPFGTSAEMNELINWSGNADAQIVTLPVGDFVPGGLRIGRGTNDTLESIVNDDITGLTEMYVYLYGYKRSV